MKAQLQQPITLVLQHAPWSCAYLVLDNDIFLGLRLSRVVHAYPFLCTLPQHAHEIDHTDSFASHQEASKHIQIP
jgi:hypothetical protein